MCFQNQLNFYLKLRKSVFQIISQEVVHRNISRIEFEIDSIQWESKIFEKYVTFIFSEFEGTQINTEALKIGQAQKLNISKKSTIFVLPLCVDIVIIWTPKRRNGP